MNENEKFSTISMTLLQSLGTIYTLPMLPSTAKRYLPYIPYHSKYYKISSWRWVGRLVYTYTVLTYLPTRQHYLHSTPLHSKYIPTYIYLIPDFLIQTIYIIHQPTYPTHQQTNCTYIVISFPIPTYLYHCIFKRYMYLNHVNTIVGIKKMAGLPK